MIFLGVRFAGCKWKIVAGTTTEKPIRKRDRRNIFSHDNQTIFKNPRTRKKSGIAVKLLSNSLQFSDKFPYGLMKIKVKHKW